MLKLTPGWLALPLVLALAACSETPKTEVAKAPATPPEPVTGRQAFQKMYPPARNWALDAVPLQLKSINLSQVKAEKGKTGAWQAIFVSPSRGKSKNYTYSVIEAEGNLHQGVFAGLEENFVVGRGPAALFDIAAIKVDSDQAFDTAAKQSADYIKKNPDKPMSYVLERTNRFPDLAWRVIWGESVGSSDYSIYVDASTGKYLEKMH
ncbi:MAG TPA: hypothetical protein VIX89_09805 [Bryobacteraceae bacterium]